MKMFIWVLFAFSVFLLASSVWRRWTYRRQGETLPWQFAGNVEGGVGMLCMIGALILEHGWLFWALLAASIVLTVIDSVAFNRARKRALGAAG